MKLGILIDPVVKDVAESLPCNQHHTCQKVACRHTKSWLTPACGAFTNGSCGMIVGAVLWTDMVEALFVNARKESRRLAVTLDLEEHIRVEALQVPMLIAVVLASQSEEILLLVSRCC